MLKTNTVWPFYMRFYDSFLPRLTAYNELLDDNVKQVFDAVKTMPYRDIRIVELGCGTGNMIVKLVKTAKTIKNKNIVITGVDLVEEALVKARKKTGHEIVFYKGDLVKKSFGLDKEVYESMKGTNIVIMNNVLFSLGEEEKKHVLAEIKAILHKDGIVISSEPGKPLSAKNIIKKQGGIFQFICTMSSVLIPAVIIIMINTLHLVRFVYPAAYLKHLFKVFGYKLKASINDAYAGSNIIQVFQLKN